MFALIMAGGVGTRFWPASREERPKQCLNIVGENTMIQDTAARISGIVPANRIFIVSINKHYDLIREQLPTLAPEQIITEPRGKNTAACIGLSALYMRRIDPEAVMVVLPSDHIVEREKAFLKVIKTGETIARKHDCLVTIGIQPTYPAVGYGYVQHNGTELDRIVGVPVYEVKTFAEKPTLEIAERFVASGDFLWNSGIFIWKINRILHEIEEKLPDLYDGLCEIDKHIGTRKEKKVIEKVYKQIYNISIDYGIMEKAQNVVVLKGDFGWRDVGSWKEVYLLNDSRDEHKNVSEGEFVSIDSGGCLISSPKKLVAAVGIHNLVVVDTDDALLICHRDRAQNVKELVDKIRRNKLDKYL